VSSANNIGSFLPLIAGISGINIQLVTIRAAGGNAER